MAAEVPIDSLGGPDQSYYLQVAVFAILATSSSSMPSVLDQLSVQLCFLGMRMVMLVLMMLTHGVLILTTLLLLLLWASECPSWTWGAYTILQNSIWSTGYQFAVPAVASTARDKRRALSIIHTAVLFILVTTLVLSLLLSFYFGPDNIRVSSNLNYGRTGILSPMMVVYLFVIVVWLGG